MFIYEKLLIHLWDFFLFFSLLKLAEQNAGTSQMLKNCLDPLYSNCL